jgi:hypothetical protein
MGSVGCPEMSVHNYHSMLRNIPEGTRFQNFKFIITLNNLRTVKNVIRLEKQVGKDKRLTFTHNYKRKIPKLFI